MVQIVRRKVSPNVWRYKTKRTHAQRGLNAQEYKDLTMWVQDQHKSIKDNILEAAARFKK